jgi:hypothetical protein
MWAESSFRVVPAFRAVPSFQRAIGTAGIRACVCEWVGGPTLVTPDESTGPIDKLPSGAHEAAQCIEAVDMMRCVGTTRDAGSKDLDGRNAQTVAGPLVCGTDAD